MTNYNLTFINNTDGSVEAHKPGCRDIARKTRGVMGADSFDLTVTSKRNAFLEYNSDFIAEDPTEDSCYPINFLPCADFLPATD